MDRADHSDAFRRLSDRDGGSHYQPRCSRFVDREGDSWRIRRADADDAAALVAMYDDFAAAERAQGLPPRTRPRIEDWVVDRLADGRNVVAANGTRIGGHALYTPTDDPEPEFAVFVHQDYQGRGLGTQLSECALATAAAGGREALTLLVESNNRVARRLYDRLGFEDVGRYESDGRRRPTIRMRRSLADAQSEHGYLPTLRRDRPALGTEAGTESEPEAGSRTDSD